MSKETRRKRHYYQFLVLTIAIVLVFGLVGVVRANINDVGDSIKGLTACVTTNPNNDVCNALVKVVNFLLPNDEESLGASFTRAQEKDASGFNGIAFLDPTNPGRSLKRFCRNQNFPTTSSTIVSVRNDNVSSMLIDYLAVWQYTNPSASLMFSFGTSTVNAADYNAVSVATATLPWGMIDRWYVASSSNPTVTSTVGVLVTNTTRGTSTPPGAVRATTVLKARSSVITGNIAGVTSVGGDTATTLRAGKNNENSLVVLPGEYFLGHLELGDYTGTAGGYQWAVTTTVSSSPAADFTSVRLRTSGDIGFTGAVEYCWTQLSTSTPQ